MIKLFIYFALRVRGGEHSVQRSCPSLCIIKGGMVVAAL